MYDVTVGTLLNHVAFAPFEASPFPPTVMVIGKVPAVRDGGGTHVTVVSFALNTEQLAPWVPFANTTLTFESLAKPVPCNVRTPGERTARRTTGVAAGENTKLVVLPALCIPPPTVTTTAAGTSASNAACSAM